MFAIIRNWETPLNRLLAASGMGRPLSVRAGSWIADLVALKKAITLCRRCRGKFSADTNGYERRKPVPGFLEAKGECDGCNGKNELCAVYFPKEKLSCVA